MGLLARVRSEPAVPLHHSAPRRRSSSRSRRCVLSCFCASARVRVGCGLHSARCHSRADSSQPPRRGHRRSTFVLSGAEIHGDRRRLTDRQITLTRSHRMWSPRPDTWPRHAQRTSDVRHCKGGGIRERPSDPRGAAPFRMRQNAPSCDLHDLAPGGPSPLSKSAGRWCGPMLLNG